MDLSSISGFLLAFGLVFLAIKDSLSTFVDTPSLMIVVGGGAAAALMSVPLMVFTKIGKVCGAAFKDRKNNPAALIESLVKYSEVARKDGILALESVLEEIKDPFLAKGIQMAVDGTDPDVISDTLSLEMDEMSARHEAGKSVFELMGKYMPAFGMIGTLVGLILMLAELDDPAKIAPNMAVALITTFYGALLANVFCIPVADKLTKKSKDEAKFREIAITGVMGIQSGDSPRVLETKLKVYLAPNQRGEEK